MPGDYDWSTAKAPKKAELTGVEFSGGTAFVSGKRGLLAEREASGEWEALFDAGATGNGRGLLDLSVTDDGSRVWFAGYSGTFGYYDRDADETKPHSAPYDITSNFSSISANGDAGAEEVHAVDRDGHLVRLRMDGEELTVKGVSVPGDGSGFTEIVDDDGVLYASDQTGRLYRSEDGRNWAKQRLTSTTIKAIARTDPGLVAVDDGGSVYKHISLFGGSGRTKKTTPGVSSPQELEASGETIVCVGGDGCVLVINESGRATREACGLDKSFYGAEILPDGTIVVAGSDGAIAEGTPDW